MDFALRFEVPIAGLILSSTMVNLESIENSSYGKVKIMCLKWLGDLFKDFILNNLDNPAALTKNCFNIKKHLDDRVNVPFIGVRFLKEFIVCCENVLANVHR